MITHCCVSIINSGLFYWNQSVPLTYRLRFLVFLPLKANIMSDIDMRAMEKSTRVLRSFQYLFKGNVNGERQTQQTRSMKLLEKNAYTCSFLWDTMQPKKMYLVHWFSNFGKHHKLLGSWIYMFTIQTPAPHTLGYSESADLDRAWSLTPCCQHSLMPSLIYSSSQPLSPSQILDK